LRAVAGACGGVPRGPRRPDRYFDASGRKTMNDANVSEPLLQVIGVHKRFTGVHALRGVTLAFARGEN